MTRLTTLALVAAGVLALQGCDSAGGLNDEGTDFGAGKYTILLSTMSGPSHAARIATYRDIVRKHTQWPESDLTVLQKGQDASALYYGTYDSFDQARARLSQIRDMKNPQGGKPFAAAIIVPLPGRDFGPKEWNLANVKTGAYTLCVGQWVDDPKVSFFQRREAAVKHCKELRAEGHEAYFYHGDSDSLVTVGIFGPKAVKMVRTGDTLRPQIVDPKARRMMESDNPKLRYLLLNGWQTKVSRVQVDPDTGRPVTEGFEMKDGQLVAKLPQDVQRSQLVRLPHFKPGTEEDEDERDRGHEPAIFDSGLPKPW